jgi:hypothetical protein
LGSNHLTVPVAMIGCLLHARRQAPSILPGTEARHAGASPSGCALFPSAGAAAMSVGWLGCPAAARPTAHRLRRVG